MVLASKCPTVFAGEPEASHADDEPVNPGGETSVRAKRDVSRQSIICIYT